MNVKRRFIKCDQKKIFLFKKNKSLKNLSGTDLNKEYFTFSQQMYVKIYLFIG